MYQGTSGTGTKIGQLDRLWFILDPSGELENWVWQEKPGH